MATATANCPADNSTLANYVSWATFISTAFQSFGWLQTNDTGQVMWTGLSISAATISGSNVTYTYSGLTGLALATGRAMAITGMTHAANNGTFVITALGVGTFTVVNASGVTETGSTGAVTKITAVPSSSFVSSYEVWKAADTSASTTPIFVKMQYGYASTAFSIQVNIGTSSNGTGTMTGNVLAAVNPTNNTDIANLGTTPIPCFASGTAGEIRFIMWQGNSVAETVFGIERSKDTSGNITTAYFTFLSACANGTGGWGQQTSIGSLVTPRELNWLSFVSTSAPQTQYFNGTCAVNPVFPMVGMLGNPMLGFCMAAFNDVGEGATVTANVYGTNHTYLGTKANTLKYLAAAIQNTEFSTTLVRYE